ncbi:MAG: hypothetical protein ACRYFU_20965 [Janthinobacterium lividum]
MIQTAISPATRDLAQRLQAFEQDAPVIADEDRLATCRVCEKLIRSLRLTVGAEGIRALLQRALTLAQREAPALREVTVQSDCSLKGLEGEAVGASSVLVAHLIELLATFIGRGLTSRLLHEVWPEVQGMDEIAERDSYEQQ